MTSRGRAACAAVFPVAPAHSTWPALRGPARATKQNLNSQQSSHGGAGTAGTKRSRAQEPKTCHSLAAATHSALACMHVRRVGRQVTCPGASDPGRVVVVVVIHHK